MVEELHFVLLCLSCYVLRLNVVDRVTVPKPELKYAKITLALEQKFL